MPKYSKAEVEEARAHLLSLLKPGDTVYCILRHVSRSGMSRQISLYAKSGDDFLPISLSAAAVLGWRTVDAVGQRAIRADGCGVDMGFHTVYTLARVLFPEGFNADDAKMGRRNRSSEAWDKDGGYALRHRWI